MSRPRRVLVIEDEDAVAQALLIRLAAAGYEPARESNGADALKRHLADAADAIVLDVRMPVMDGFEFLENLGPDAVAKTPIIMVSANHQDEVARRAAELGVTRVISKPYRASELMQILRDALEPAA